MFDFMPQLSASKPFNSYYILLRYKEHVINPWKVSELGNTRLLLSEVFHITYNNRDQYKLSRRFYPF